MNAENSTFYWRRTTRCTSCSAPPFIRLHSPDSFRCRIFLRLLSFVGKIRMGLSQPASQSAVLRSAQPCSDNESPPETHSLSGSSPIPSFKKEKQRLFYAVFYLAEDMGLEPTRLLHPTRFPGELLSHSVNPPHRFYIFAMRNSLRYKMSVPF